MTKNRKNRSKFEVVLSKAICERLHSTAVWAAVKFSGEPLVTENQVNPGVNVQFLYGVGIVRITYAGGGEFEVALSEAVTIADIIATIGDNPEIFGPLQFSVV